MGRAEERATMVCGVQERGRLICLFIQCLENIEMLEHSMQHRKNTNQDPEPLNPENRSLNGEICSFTFLSVNHFDSL